jgi:hypothetical protein
VKDSAVKHQPNLPFFVAIESRVNYNLKYKGNTMNSSQLAETKVDV